MALRHTTWTKVIKEVAEQNEFSYTEGDSYYRIKSNRDLHHSIGFQIDTSRSGFLEVSELDDEGECMRAVFSIRTTSDVVQFCNILICSEIIRARR